jgi:hypothetical protein
MEADHLSLQHERFTRLKGALAAVPAGAVGRRRFEAIAALDSFTVGPDHRMTMSYCVLGSDGKPTLTVGGVAEDVVELWREEMNRTPHRAMKAQYAHLLWERQHDQRIAWAAIDAYLAASEAYLGAIQSQDGPETRQHFGLEFSRMVGAAIQLGAHVRDQERVVRATELALAALGTLLAARALAAFEDVLESLLETRQLRSHLRHDDICRALDEAVGIAEASHADEWHRTFLRLQVRQAQLRGDGQRERQLRQRIAQSHADEAEHYAGMGHKMAASASYKAAIGELRQAGIKGTVLDALMSANREVLAVLGPDEFTSTEIEADTEIVREMPSLAKALVDEHGAEAILHLPQWTAPHLPDIEAQVQTEYSSLMLNLPTSVFGDGRLVASASSPESIFSFHVGQLYVACISLYGSYFVNQLVNAMTYEADLGAQELAAVIESVGVVEPWRRQLIHHALSKYVEGDLVSFMFIIVPQVEGIVRNILGMLGCPVDVEKDGLTQARALNDMLSDPALSGRLGTNITYQLKSVLTDRSGPNLRNMLAHGLPFDCNPRTAGLVMLALCNMCSRWALGNDALPATE